jgi:hypothetical protein
VAPTPATIAGTVEAIRSASSRVAAFQRTTLATTASIVAALPAMVPSGRLTRLPPGALLPAQPNVPAVPAGATISDEDHAVCSEGADQHANRGRVQVDAVGDDLDGDAG